MDKSKIRIVDHIYTNTRDLVEYLHDDIAKVTAYVSIQNGVITSIDDIRVCATDLSAFSVNTEMAPHGMAETQPDLLWSGVANPNISGQFYQSSSGHELEIFSCIMDFINAVRTEDPLGSDE